MNIAARGGPKTKAGKKISSKNALKHGLTSVNLICPEEQSHYDFLLSELYKEYDPKTITEKLYISKIASLQIRLERLINAEQASIALEQKNVADGTVVLDSLDIDMDSKNQYVINQMAGLYEDESNEAEMKRSLQKSLLSNMSHLMGQAPISSYEIIQEHYPFLHLIFQIIALREKIIISDFFKAPHYEQEKLASRIVAMDKITKEECLQVIKEKNVDPRPNIEEELQPFLEKLFRKLLNLNVAAWIDSEYDNLKELHLQTAMPDPATMDRFMRYSTTLSNQLSKAFGELRHIIKERKAAEKTITNE